MTGLGAMQIGHKKMGALHSLTHTKSHITALK